MAPVGIDEVHVGGQLPHFELTTVEGRRIRYVDLWQRRNLVLLLFDDDGRPGDAYTTRLLSRAADFEGQETVLVLSRDSVQRLPAPAIIVADRWGEVVHLAQPEDTAAWPTADDLLEWVTFVRMQCPECPPL